MPPCAGCLRQCLAMIVGAGEPAEIAAIADAVAGQEEAGVGGLRLRGRAGGNRYGRNGEACRQDDPERSCSSEVSPCCFLRIRLCINPPRASMYSGAVRRSRKHRRHSGQRKRRRGTNRSAFCRHVAAISWSAGSPRVPSRRRAGGRRSTLRWLRSACRCSRPDGRWCAPVVLSTSENRIATLAKSVSPSRQGFGEVALQQLDVGHLVDVVAGLVLLEILGEVGHHLGRRQRMQFGDVLVRPRGLDLTEQTLEGFIVSRLDFQRRLARSQPKATQSERKLVWAPGPSAAGAGPVA